MSTPILPHNVPILFPDDSPRVRATDPVSSHEAADATASIVQASQRAVAEIFEKQGKPLTEKEVEQLGIFTYGLPYSESRLRSACSELEKLGILRRGDFRRLPGEKRRRQLWTLAGAA